MRESLRIPSCTALLALALTTTDVAQSAAPVSKQVEIYGQKINYLEAGSSGPPVILIHGLGGDATNWGPTIPTLAAKFRVYAPDQIGFRQSDKPIINYRVAPRGSKRKISARNTHLSPAHRTLSGQPKFAFCSFHGIFALLTKKNNNQLIQVFP
jgi:hypothetical protein